MGRLKGVVRRRCIDCPAYFFTADRRRKCGPCRHRIFEARKSAKAVWERERNKAALSLQPPKPGREGFAMIDDNAREIDSDTLLRQIYGGRRFCR